MRDNALAHEILVIARMFPALRPRLVVQSLRFSHHHPEGRVVTFIDELEGLCFVDQGDDQTRGVITSWRTVLPSEQYEQLWQKSYERADRYVEGLSGDLLALLRPYYHTIADHLHRGLVLEALLEQSVEPVLAIMPGSSKAYGGFPASASKLASWPDALGLTVRRIGLITSAAVSRFRPAKRAGRGELSSTEQHVSRGEVADEKLSGRRESRAGHILIAVQEGVAAVNSPSAFATASALQEQGYETVILTHNRSIRNQAKGLGIAVLCPVELSIDIVRPSWWRFYRNCHRQLGELVHSSTSSFIDLDTALYIKKELRLWAALHATASTMMDQYHRKTAPLKAGLLINEGTPVSGQALNWLRQNKIPDIGYWPALLGVRPDCNYFPASHHLAYGEQLASHMQQLGVAQDTVQTVGSVNYDLSLGRDHHDDTNYVRREILPDWREGQPLVVVASEALNNSFEELGPVLRALVDIEDVALVLKLHPADQLQVFEACLEREGLKGRVEIVTKCDLDALLHAADLLICVLSNIIVNAALLDTPTLVCDFSNKRRPLDFVEHGLALGCFDEEQLAQAIKDMLPGGNLREKAEDLLRTGLKGFNNPADGGSAERIAHIVATAARRGEKLRSDGS